MLTIIAAALAVLSFCLTLWQWLVASRFPLHRRIAGKPFEPAVTLLKPLKGCDSETEACLQSWLQLESTGDIQLLFGVACADDPVCDLVRELIEANPQSRAELIICPRLLGANAKVSTLVQLEAYAVHEFLVISDADVCAPPDLLPNLLGVLENPAVGLVNCFYRLTHTTSWAMQWEAVAVNADFWSQVLQARALKRLDFALGAVMATSRSQLEKIGGLNVLLEYLADDYQLGHRLARQGARIELCPVVVECRSELIGWKAVWHHQLRWARTVRVCEPVPFFFSILSNGTVWPLIWMLAAHTPLAFAAAGAFCLMRMLSARSMQRRMMEEKLPWTGAWLTPMKDLLGLAIWALAFVGNDIEWRGRRYHILPDGRLAEILCIPESYVAPPTSA